MLFDGIRMTEGSTAINLTLPTGESFPNEPTLGELFYKTGTSEGVHVYDGSNWTITGSGGSGGASDHGALTGLSDDDHTQYALADGTRGSFASATHNHDAAYVNVSGDTMTGALILHANPSTALGAATKQYVDAQDTTIAGKVSKTGDTMTGYLVLAANPTLDYHAATKFYVDDHLSGKAALNHSHDSTYLPTSGGTVTGNLSITGVTTINNGVLMGRTSEQAVVLGAVSGPIDINLLAGFYVKATIIGTTSVTFMGAPGSLYTSSIMVELTNAGSYTITWPVGTKWAGGTSPTFTTSGTDLISFTTSDGGMSWVGCVIALDFK